MMPEQKAKALAKGATDLKKHWRVENGVIVNDGQGAYLTTDKDYGDIELLVDFKIGPKGDSGIYLRGTPQVQIWDFTEPAMPRMGADKGSGGLWNNSTGHPGKDPLVLADKPIGEWNTFRIIQVGERTTVYLNDKLVVDHARWRTSGTASCPCRPGPDPAPDPRPRDPLAEYLDPRDPGARRPTPILAKHDRRGLPIRLQRQEPRRLGRPRRELRGQRRRPDVQAAQGRNDLLQQGIRRLRRPGRVQAAARRQQRPGDPLSRRRRHRLRRHVRVPDPRRRRTRSMPSIDPRQAHGSAYGMVAAKRGYLRPVGQWNFEEVTVKGPKIKVELNGTVILDTDLSQVKEFMANSPHPGKDRTSGFFGFAGHSDPVEFRNVSDQAARLIRAVNG